MAFVWQNVFPKAHQVQNHTVQAPEVTTSPVATEAIPSAINLLAPENGWHVLVASSDDWAGTIDGRESGKQISYGLGKSAVFAFKDERPATFDTFAMLITGTEMNNVKEFELLQGNESPTGFFQSIGKFQTQNAKLFEKPYQEFKFSPVTAKYLKVKILSTYGFPHPWVYQWQLFGALQAKPPEVTASPVAAAAIPNAMDLLASENGGHVLVASSDDWARTIDGRESGAQISYGLGKSAVFAFKDERPATFDTFAMLITGTEMNNVKEFELLQGNESPTGFFQSIGKFQTQNVKLFEKPYQEFKFSPVTAKYLKVKILSTWSGFPHPWVYQWQLFGALQAKPPEVTASPVATAAIPNAIDLLASENGGHVLVASSNDWAGAIDGKQSGKQISYAVGHSAVFTFKDERPATFDLFTMLIPETDGWNIKEFELLQGNESPTGFFQSIGKFQTRM